MIRLNDISFAYDRSRPVLSHVSLQIGKGERVGIAGANGAGKSTLLKLLVGLLFPDPMGKTPQESGWIGIAGTQVTKKNLAAVRQKIGYVFQDSDAQLFMPTVEKDVAFAPKNYGLDAAQTQKRVEEALSLVGIEDLKKRSVLELSGGQKKLVSLATVLSMRPDILLFDEPTIALDPGNRRRFIRILPELGGTHLIVSHDLDLLLETCGRIILLSEGRIVADGDTETILRDQSLLEANGLELPLLIQGQRLASSADQRTHK